MAISRVYYRPFEAHSVILPRLRFNPTSMWSSAPPLSPMGAGFPVRWSAVLGTLVAQIRPHSVVPLDRYLMDAVESVTTEAAPVLLFPDNLLPELPCLEFLRCSQKESE